MKQVLKRILETLLLTIYLPCITFIDFCALRPYMCANKSTVLSLHCTPKCLMRFCTVEAALKSIFICYCLRFKLLLYSLYNQ